MAASFARFCCCLVAVAARSDAWDNVGFRYVIPLSTYPMARCLDGTPSVVYIRNTTSTKWLLFLPGAGYCMSLEDCLQRSKFSDAGSTINDTNATVIMNQMQEPWIFEPDPSLNPLMHDFNWVIIRYCSGDYFAGDVAEPVKVGASGEQVFFRGRFIREAVVDFLRKEQGMDKATDVVLSGCSSGAITTFWSLDVWRGLMSWVPRVSGFADSGYFLDTGMYTSPHKFMWEQMNGTASPYPACVAEHKDKPWSCYDAPNAILYTRTPIFAWQSRYDTDQLESSTECENNATCVNSFGESLLTSVQTNLVGPHGFLVDACSRHCWWPRKTLSVQGYTPLTAFAEWYSGKPVRIVQSGVYPCQDCCDTASIGVVV